MSERTSNKNKWIKRTAGVLVAPIAAVAVSSCSSEAKCEPRATVTVTAEAKPTASAPSVKTPEAKPTTMSNQQVDAAFAQGVAALKSGDIKGAKKIYYEELLSSGSALGTEKDYDGDGDKEYPWKSMANQIVDAHFAQGVAALKSGDIKGAKKIYYEELLSSGSALGTEKDYDGDGDKEYPWKSMKEQLEKAK